MRIAIVFFLIGAAANAQQIGQTVASDLNDDRRVEQFSLIDNGNGQVDLQIENTGSGVIYSEGIAWLGGFGQQPELTLADNGSVLLTSMNEAVGRNRWHLTLTIAYRDGGYIVAGITYDSYDTLDLEAFASCDLNLLTGRGFASYGQGGEPIPVASPLSATPVTQWRDDTQVPDICFRPDE